MSSPSSPSARHCPSCGARVSHAAADCFMCGHVFAEPGRRWRLPFADIALLLGICLVLAVWWRWDTEQQVLALTPSPTPTPTLTPTPAPTATPIPTATATPTATPTPTPVFYTVRSGDTLLGIAANFGLTLDQLLAGNGLTTPPPLRPGQILIIPPPPTPAPTSAPVAAANTPVPINGVINYQVQPGDTLNAIAARFAVPLGDILTANDIGDPNKLIPGTILVIRVSAPTENETLAAPLPTPVYDAPVIVGPADRSEFTEIQPPLLRWVAVGDLPADSWYKVSLAYADPGMAMPEPILTKTTSLRLDRALRPPTSASSAELLWWVSVARQTADGSLLPLSPPSTVQHLYWQ